MKRKKQILLFLLIIIIMVFSYMRLNDRYLTPEGVFYACEKGLRYGPSEKILYEYKKDFNNVIVVGKYKNGLSIIQTQRKMFGLWGIAPGLITGFRQPRENENIVFYINQYYSIAFGRVTNKDVKIVNISAYLRNEELYEIDINNKVFEKEIDVDEEGFFKLEGVTDYNDGIDTSYIFELKGLDSLGNIVEEAEF